MHIGPPKTATTSLQFFFQKLNHPQIFYAGTYQPRKENKPSICERLRVLIQKGEVDKAENLVKQIKDYLDKGISVFISEEMFLVESLKVSYLLKIKRLFSVLKDSNPKVVFFIRKPEKVIPSYFSETYNGGSVKNIKSFVGTPKCGIYKYKTLKRNIRDIGFKQVIVLDYKRLIGGKYYLSDLLDNLNEDRAISLGQENVSKKKKSQYYSKHQVPLTFKETLLNKVMKLKNIPVLKLFFGLRLRRFIPNIKKNKKLDTKLPQKALEPFIEEYKAILNEVS